MCCVCAGEESTIGRYTHACARAVYELGFRRIDIRQGVETRRYSRIVMSICTSSRYLQAFLLITYRSLLVDYLFDKNDDVVFVTSVPT